MRVRLPGVVAVTVTLVVVAVLLGRFAGGAPPVAFHHLAAAAPNQVGEALAGDLVEEVEAQAGREPELCRRLVTGVEMLVVRLRPLDEYKAALLPVDALAIDQGVTL